MPKTLTKEMWAEWRSHPVTSNLYDALEERIEDGKEELANCDVDPQRDLIIRGMIRAFREVIDIKPDFSE